MKLSIAAFFVAFSAFAGTELVWDEPAWERMPAAAAAKAGTLEFKSGDQHVLSFSGGVVRASHSVTDRTFDFAKTPFEVGQEGWVLPEGEGALLLASGRRDGEGRFEGFWGSSSCAAPTRPTTTSAAAGASRGGRCR